MHIQDVFLGADLRQGHEGLVDHAKKKGVKLRELPPQTGVVFFNRKMTGMKLYGSGGMLGYLRRDELQRPFDLEAVSEFHRCFDKNGELDYDKALKLRLEKFMAKRGQAKIIEDDFKKL